MSEINKQIKTIYDALMDKKAFDIRIIDISNVSDISDYFIIADGSNRNQVQAMCDNVEEFMLQIGKKPKSVEGYADGGWILLDYYDIIVHIFSDEARRFYDIERIWSDGRQIAIEGLA